MFPARSLGNRRAGRSLATATKTEGRTGIAVPLAEGFINRLRPIGASVEMTTTGAEMTATGAEMTTTGVQMTTAGVEMTTTGAEMTATGVGMTTTGVLEGGTMDSWPRFEGWSLLPPR